MLSPVQPLTAGVRPRPIRRDCFCNLDAEVAARKSQQKIGALALFEVERITENVRRGIRSQEAANRPSLAMLSRPALGPERNADIDRGELT